MFTTNNLKRYCVASPSMIGSYYKEVDGCYIENEVGNIGLKFEELKDGFIVSGKFKDNNKHFFFSEFSSKWTVLEVDRIKAKFMSFQLSKELTTNNNNKNKVNKV